MAAFDDAFKAMLLRTVTYWCDVFPHCTLLFHHTVQDLGHSASAGGLEVVRVCHMMQSSPSRASQLATPA